MTVDAIILFGPPNSGKGTVSKQLEQRLGLRHISSGDLLRTHIHANPDQGQHLHAFMSRGDLVPDPVIQAMMKRRLSLPDTHTGVILDGFPRNLAQADHLPELLASVHLTLKAVFSLEVPDAELQRRASLRRVCSACGAPHSLDYEPLKPKVDGVCNKCGGKLILRSDDEPDVVKKRLDLYHAQTAPLLDYYQQRGLLQRVNGAGESVKAVEDIVARMGNKT